jgi:hypothetical protein
LKSPKRIPSNLFEINIFTSAENMMHGSREDRVLAFEEFIQRINDISVYKTEIVSFMLGYLASRIAPGTIRHSNVLGQLTHKYPTALLWYGFCAGFPEGGSSLSNGSQWRGVDLPLGARRIMRELLRPVSIFYAPICDIGYQELIALSRTGGEPLESLIKTIQGSITVELLPGVCTSINVHPKLASDSKVREPREQEIIVMLGEQIELLNKTYKKLIEDSTSRKPEQKSLFTSRRKKK